MLPGCSSGCCLPQGETQPQAGASLLVSEESSPSYYSNHHHLLALSPTATASQEAVQGGEDAGGASGRGREHRAST